ncbi:hypothetical protein EG68_03802 [Paragonimus skrjabini miyazakii]|uniref:Uncharacterized protein n=1 Tax=Paragonimus skrjabini miyazakii TaxID=59628 RepID=A0A8S9YZ99_9TREM|nr:hypothetical protein EG68_03802 [Paragonimus skrjabini miyazakii]
MEIVLYTGHTQPTSMRYHKNDTPVSNSISNEEPDEKSAKGRVCGINRVGSLLKSVFTTQPLTVRQGKLKNSHKNTGPGHPAFLVIFLLDLQTCS